MTYLNYNEAKQKITEQVGAEFDATCPPDTANNVDRNKRRAAISTAIEQWVLTQPSTISIEVTHDRSGAKIEDLFYHGYIEVKRPRRDIDWANGESFVKIVPGYISGSSWEAGSYRGQGCTHTAREAANRVRMMGMAIMLLNEFNQTLADWRDVDNPIFECEQLREQVRCYRERDLSAAKAEQEHKDKRKSKLRK